MYDRQRDALEIRISQAEETLADAEAMKKAESSTALL